MPSRQTAPDSCDAEPSAAAGVEPFLAALFRAGVRVSVAGGKLRCVGPAEALQGPLGAGIRARKPEIIAFLAGRGAAAEGAIPARDAAEPPLSAAQTRLWIVERMRPEAAHHIPFALEAEGALEIDALRRALSRLMARHEALRLRIEVRDGAPHQRIAAETEPPFRLIDAAGMDQAEIDALIAAEAARRFDLSVEPPLRLLALRRAEGAHVLLFTLHH
ncbi:MAG: condensation domain-containing protein, partial [Pikeienuella sp.]